MRKNDSDFKRAMNELLNPDISSDRGEQTGRAFGPAPKPQREREGAEVMLIVVLAVLCIVLFMRCRMLAESYNSLNAEYSAYVSGMLTAKAAPSDEPETPAGEKEGCNFLICSVYRDYEKQEELVEESIDDLMKHGMDYKEAFYETKRQIDLTGTSEHHTGLAVDIVGYSYQSLDEGQANTKEAKWLAEHAHEYGFILRYPQHKEEITGIDFEPWHYRYVGKNAAAYIKENDLCLEEFIELAENQSEKDTGQ